MVIVRYIAYCPEGQGEVGPQSLDCAACLIEETVSLQLVELFGNVLVVEVSVTDSSLEDACDDSLSSAA